MKTSRIGLVHDSRATPPGLPAILMHSFGTRTAELNEVMDYGAYDRTTQSVD